MTNITNKSNLSLPEIFGAMGLQIVNNYDEFRRLNSTITNSYASIIWHDFVGWQHLNKFGSMIKDHKEKLIELFKAINNNVNHWHYYPTLDDTYFVIVEENVAHLMEEFYSKEKDIPNEMREIFPEFINLIAHNDGLVLIEIVMEPQGNYKG